MKSARKRVVVASLAVVTALMLACGPQVTFSKDVAPILQAKCQSCHRPGQLAPMSLVNYEEVRPFAPVIRISVSIGNMPPLLRVGPARLLQG